MAFLDNLRHKVALYVSSPDDKENLRVLHKLLCGDAYGTRRYIGHGAKFSTLKKALHSWIHYFGM
jgi:hypothetical protein